MPFVLLIIARRPGTQISEVASTTAAGAQEVVEATKTLAALADTLEGLTGKFRLDAKTA